MQLYAGQPAAGSVQDLYTVPSGRRVTVRDIVITNVSTGNPNVTIFCPYSRRLFTVDLGARYGLSATYHWEGKVVLLEGQKISYYVAALSPIDVVVSGSRYYI